MKSTTQRKLKLPKVHPQYIILICVIFLVVFGIAMVFSASSYIAERNYGDRLFFVKKQIVGAVMGAVALVFFCFLNIEKLKKFSWIALGISIALLLIVFIPGVGSKAYGANRWINLGFFTIQASEIAKFGFILFAATMLAKVPDKIKNFKAMLPTLIAGCSVCLLIILEPNMSITMCVGATMLIMLFVGGVSFKHFMLLLVPALLLVPVLILIEPYRMSRLTAFIDPWSSPLEEGFQLIQSYYALGAGGWFGIGFGNSRQKFLFLPFSESDFIFSIIGEELGYIGCIFIMLLFVLIIISGFKIARTADSRFKCYLATGITAIITMQFLVNIAVVTGSIPPTGLPLPFISAGSSALIMFMAGVGALIACAKPIPSNTKKWFTLAK